MAGRLLLLFIIVPMIELWLLIKIGGIIGAGWTILLIIATALIGSQLVRYQGLGVIQRSREQQMRGEMPAIPMLEGMALLLAGFCLITPGLISDSIGFLLLIPQLRAWVARRILARAVTVHAAGPYGYSHTWSSHHKHSSTTVIEGDYKRRDED